MFLDSIIYIGLGDAKMNKLILGSGGGGITSTANRFFPGGSAGFSETP